jgi:hypothetical protein
MSTPADQIKPNPGAAPMATEQRPEGEQLASKVSILGARRVLEQQLLKWPRGSTEARQIMKSLKALTRITGKDEDESEELSGALLKTYTMDLLGPKPVSKPQTPPPGAAPQPNPTGAQPLGPGAPMGGMPPQ